MASNGSLARLSAVLLLLFLNYSPADGKKAKIRAWMTGRLLSVKTTTIETGGTARISEDGRRADISQTTEHASTYEIDGGDTWYLVAEFEKETGISAFMRGYNRGGPRHMYGPRLTKLKESLRYAVEKDGFYIIDEDGKEFRGRIILQERKAGSERVSESATPPDLK